MKPAPSPAPAKARPPSPVEVGAAASFFVAALVLAVALGNHRLAQRPIKPVADPLAGTVIVPQVSLEGVTVTPGRARLLFADSTPDGADLLLDGVRRGETPFSTDFACEEGHRTVLELKKPGYQTSRFELDCVEGSTRVVASLKRAR